MDREISPACVARVPFRTILASIAGLWVAYFLLTTIRAELLEMPLALDMAWRRLITSLAGAVITLGLWLALRPFDARPLWAKITAALVFALPAAMLSAQVNWIVFADMQAAIDKEAVQIFVEERGLGMADDGADLMIDLSDLIAGVSHAQMVDLAFSRYFMLLAWCALYLALLTGEKARAAERREGAYRRAAKAAELRSLRYQVNPHFLFNTLNSLSAMVLTGKVEEAERMIQMIARFYRRSLADDPTGDVTLAEEMALQKLYLDIEAVRFPRRLKVEFAVPEELSDALVPGMILQPLVENSVKHALAPSSGQVTVTLSAREEFGRLVLTVSDDGDGVMDHQEDRPGFGIGLANVRDRLGARFGKDASIVSGPAPGGYTTHLRLPIAHGHGAGRSAKRPGIFEEPAI